MSLFGSLRLVCLLVFPVLIENDLSASPGTPEFLRVAIGQTANQSVSDLPLNVMEAKTASDMPLLVFITGDGGWNNFSRSICENLAVRGIPVVALDSKKYFWESKTPEQTTLDISSVIQAYTRLWRRDKIVIAGYSFGAAVVPFLINRFPPEVKKMVSYSILLAPDSNSDFEIHLSDMLNMGIIRGKYNVIKEIMAGDFKNYIAIFSSDENKKVEESYNLPGVKVETCEGNHHFDGGYNALANLIFAEIKGK